MKQCLIPVVIALALIGINSLPAAAGGVSSSGAVARATNGVGLLSSQQIEEEYRAEIGRIWFEFGVEVTVNTVKAGFVTYAVLTSAPVAAPVAVAKAIVYVVTTGTDLALTATGVVPEKPFVLKVVAPLITGFNIGWDIGGIADTLGN
ncbi:MAG: hypothetical protein IIA72_06155 [Proteobacteria bacterium]|nr:hypothetical protein [Pseudomonadota bacterium]